MAVNTRQMSAYKMSVQSCGTAAATNQSQRGYDSLCIFASNSVQQPFAQHLPLLLCQWLYLFLASDLRSSWRTDVVGAYDIMIGQHRGFTCSRSQIFRADADRQGFGCPSRIPLLYHCYCRWLIRMSLHRSHTISDTLQTPDSLSRISIIDDGGARAFLISPIDGNFFGAIV